MTYRNKINQHYNLLLKKEGFNFAGLGWKSGKLNKRFQIFLDEINFSGKNILDFGGGLCYLNNFLKKKKIKLKKYTCYEINKNIIDYIHKYNKNKFNKDIIITSKFPKKFYDVTIVNGVYNYNYKINKKIMFQDLKKIFKITKEAVGISFLNNNVDYKERHLYYHNEIEIIKYCLGFFKNIKILKSFSKYETFIILKKNEILY